LLRRHLAGFNGEYAEEAIPPYALVADGFPPATKAMLNPNLEIAARTDFN
jgi:hypothetical protein